MHSAHVYLVHIMTKSCLLLLFFSYSFFFFFNVYIRHGSLSLIWKYMLNTSCSFFSTLFPELWRQEIGRYGDYQLTSRRGCSSIRLYTAIIEWITLGCIFIFIFFFLPSFIYDISRLLFLFWATVTELGKQVLLFSYLFWRNKNFAPASGIATRKRWSSIWNFMDLSLAWLCK